jgi:enoyl-CoA hydratase/3-hydroxyacyl-CoA dehydrogenase
MSVSFAHRTISRVAVIGSGQIGPDIALHFAKVLPGVAVTVVDVSEAALAAGKARVTKKITKGAETGAFKPAQAEAMLAALTFTSDYSTISGAELVVEAATEDEGLKGRIFAQVEALVAKDAILLSNSSHLEPERIFATLKDKSRAAVAHYFFPAERNLVVEIVTGEDTDPAISAWLMLFYEVIGKLPIAVKSRYGYAADPIFEGIFQAACLCVEEGLGTVMEVDWAAREALGMTVGPFTAMNLTGGNPITQHGLDTMHERFATREWSSPWYKSPKLLNDLLAKEGAAGKWQTAGRGEVVVLPGDQNRRIVDALRGAYLSLTFGIVDTGIIALGDYELCIETALDLKGPCLLANELGVENALHLVEAYCATHETMSVPRSLRLQVIAALPFEPSPLVLEDRPTHDGIVRLIRIRRPKVLNALNHLTYEKIAEAVAGVLGDSRVIGAVISGYGAKAFVSGADIHALHKIQTPDDGYAIAKLAQDVERVIALSPKPIVAAMNGLAFGGGLELAMACHQRVAVAKQKVLCGLPEVNLGIIPAAGGTQRLPRLIGLERAQVLLRTGGTLSSDEALAAGLVSELAAPADLLEVAVNRVSALAAGDIAWTQIDSASITDEQEPLPPVEIGHRSKAVDALLCEAISWGAAHSLDEGLAHELEVFKRICTLLDMRIGVDHFVQNGPKSPAPFVHG